MNWNEFRASYYKTHGSTSRQQLSQEYHVYKNKLSKQIKIRSPVKKLTLKDINDMAKGKKFIIIVIYANWCGHCQEMKQRLGKKMKNTEKIVFIEENKLDNQLKEYYPRVLYYQDSKRQKDLTVDDVYTYLL